MAHMSVKSRIRAMKIVLSLFAFVFAFALTFATQEVQATDIKIIVNKQAITSTDLSRRVALLRLQQRRGNLNQIARDELTEQALKIQEMQRLNAVPGQATVNASFGRFASSNRMTSAQLSRVLGQAGVTASHFKEFVSTQIGWQRVLDARFGRGASGGLSNQDLVSKMLERGDDKPSTTEYILQQVIFVVPQAKRSKSFINRRNREAKNFRAKVESCDTTKSLTKGILDVTVRDLGRFLQPELPPDWAPLIKKTSVNTPTTTRVTDKGVEFILICKSRTVTDDVAAEMVFLSEQDDNPANDANTKKYISELRKRAVIINK